MRAKPVGSKSDHNCQKTLLIFASTYSGFARQSDKHGNFCLCLDQYDAGEDILAGKDRLSGGNCRARRDAEPKAKLRATSAAFGDGGIYTQWPEIIAKRFIGRSPMAGSVQGLAHWR